MIIAVTAMHPHHHERTEKNEQEWPISENRPMEEIGQDCEADEANDGDVGPGLFHG